jgi:hypothetical protein
MQRDHDKCALDTRGEPPAKTDIIGSDLPTEAYQCRRAHGRNSTSCEMQGIYNRISRDINARGRDTLSEEIPHRSLRRSGIPSRESGNHFPVEFLRIWRSQITRPKASLDMPYRGPVVKGR